MASKRMNSNITLDNCRDAWYLEWSSLPPCFRLQYSWAGVLDRGLFLPSNWAMSTKRSGIPLPGKSSIPVKRSNISAPQSRGAELTARRPSAIASVSRTERTGSLPNVLRVSFISLLKCRVLRTVEVDWPLCNTQCRRWHQTTEGDYTEICMNALIWVEAIYVFIMRCVIRISWIYVGGPRTAGEFTCLCVLLTAHILNKPQ